MKEPAPKRRKVTGNIPATGISERLTHPVNGLLQIACASMAAVMGKLQAVPPQKQVLRLLTLLGFLMTFSWPAAAIELKGKRVLFIDSYHQGYVWSDGVTRGVKEVLEGTGINLKIHRMDTKRNRSEAFILKAARRARTVIDKFSPHAVIISDDIAVKHVLQAFFKNADLPFVFCGVNWDASAYGLPYSNTTGMVEINLVKALLRQLRPYASGERIGFLALDSFGSKKNINWHKRSENIHYHKVYLVKTYKKWKERYRDLQQEVDMVIIGNQNGLKGWDNSEVSSFIRRNTRVPSGSLAPGRMRFSLLGYLSLPEEQGRWAAKATLKILDGVKPSAIPVTRNRKGHVVINRNLSEKLGIIFPAALFKRAEVFLPYQGKKLLHISSYFPETVSWSRKIHTALLKELKGTGVELKVFIMGAKRNSSEQHLRKKALEAKRLIKTFSPDVVITSDDAAVKYLVIPHYRDSDLPFVFSGLNWDASIYGLPFPNVTGMEEVELILPLLKQLKRYAKGPRLGWLSENTVSQKRNAAYHHKLYNITYDKTYMVNTYEDWQSAFLKLQNEVDMLVIEAPHAVQGWNKDKELAFTQEHTRIVTGSLTENQMPYTVIGYVRLPEEQGEWAAQTALRIIDGTKPVEIPIVQNKKGRLMLNRRLIKKLGLLVDRSLYRRAEIVE